jgi:Domain of unknown function (DUF4864)
LQAPIAGHDFLIDHGAETDLARLCHCQFNTALQFRQAVFGRILILLALHLRNMWRTLSKRGNAMKLSYVLALVFALVVSPVCATAQSTADAAAMQGVVESQLQAFAADDGAKAYGFAAPIVQQTFPTVDVFMAMVKGGYRPVYRNSEHKFGPVAPDSTGRPAVHVMLTAEDGKRWEAVYSMEQQKDGSWKIAGCYLRAVPGTDV